MTMKDIMKSNLTSEEGIALKISAPPPRKGNATRSPMTILPSFNKGKGAKDHVTSTPYATDQETVGKEPRFGLSSQGDLQGSSLIDLAWEFTHKYTQLRIHASMEAQVNWVCKLIFSMCIKWKLSHKVIRDYVQIHLHVFYKLVT